MVELDEDKFRGYNVKSMSLEDLHEKADILKEMIYPYIFGRKYEEYFESDIIYDQVENLSNRLTEFTDEIFRRERKENHSYW